MTGCEYAPLKRTFQKAEMHFVFCLGVSGTDLHLPHPVSCWSHHIHKWFYVISHKVVESISSVYIYCVTKWTIHVYVSKCIFECSFLHVMNILSMYVLALQVILASLVSFLLPTNAVNWTAVFSLAAWRICFNILFKK